MGDMERFLLFLKLFIGMGIMWTFEIIAGLSGDVTDESVWHFTNVLIMLQGFYVFLIFACKRNVYEALFKKTDPRQFRGQSSREGLLKTQMSRLVSAESASSTKMTGFLSCASN